MNKIKTYTFGLPPIIAVRPGAEILILKDILSRLESNFVLEVFDNI
jgi:hypothetical protein